MTTREPPLTLAVENFGPIIEGKIDLRPLTVFVGPSNTGKSYLAVLIYALHRFFGDDRGRRIGFSSRTALVRNASDSGMQRVWEQVESWIERLNASDKSQGLLRDDPRVLPDSIVALIAESLAGQGEGFALELVRCFGAGMSELTRRPGRASARIAVSRTTADYSSESRAHDFLFQPKQKVLDARIQRIFLSRDNLRSRDWSEWLMLQREMYRPSVDLDPYQRSLLFGGLIDCALPQLVGPLNATAHYLPADRTGVMHAHSVVVRALIDSAPMAGLRPIDRSPTLSGVLADFLEQLIQIDSRLPWLGRRRKRLTAHATRMEKAMLQGAVRMEPGEASGYPRFSYQPEGWKDGDLLPLMNASSMVSELAPVVLYLRHRVVPGDLLIIEEPESHLHPAMQVEFTRQIAALVRAGVRVLITTHSEWVLEELSSIVQASALPEARRKDVPSGAVALSKEDVGVWCFQPKKRPKGTRIEEVRLDGTDALYSDSFSTVSARTYNDWACIVNQVEGTS